MGIQIANIRKENGIYDILVPENINLHEGKMYIKNIGNAILLIPCDAPWQNFFESLDHFSEDFAVVPVKKEFEIRETL
jgi:virulence-associated protein VagC